MPWQIFYRVLLCGHDKVVNTAKSDLGYWGPQRVKQQLVQQLLLQKYGVSLRNKKRFVVLETWMGCILPWICPSLVRWWFYHVRLKQDKTLNTTNTILYPHLTLCGTPSVQRWVWRGGRWWPWWRWWWLQWRSSTAPPPCDWGWRRGRGQRCRSCEERGRWGTWRSSDSSDGLEHFYIRDIPQLKLQATYAIVDPGAVMVKYLNAVVADRAVTAARRSIELASDTPCCRNMLVS